MHAFLVILLHFTTTYGLQIIYIYCSSMVEKFSWHLFPTLCSMAPCWAMMGIYTLQKLENALGFLFGFFFFPETQLLNIYQHSTASTEG